MELPSNEWVLTPIDPPLNRSAVDELRRRVAFFAAGVIDFELVFDGAFIVALKVHFSPGVDKQLGLSQVIRGVSHEFRNQPDFGDPQITWRSCSTRELTDQWDTGGQLLENEHASGRASMHGDLGKLPGLLDALIMARVAPEDVQAVRLPILLPRKTLERSGYFNSFPHYLFSVFGLESNFDSLSALAIAAGEGNKAEVERLLSLATTDTAYHLPPTVCYAMFEFLSEATNVEHASFSARSPSFRNEGMYVEPLLRQLDFTIRETLFVGARQYVEDRAFVFRENFLHMIDDLELAAHEQVANDPFFGGTGASARVRIQRMRAVKHEVLVTVGPSKMTAVASFNTHNSYFASRFRFGKDALGSDPTVTACCGIGLERLSAAILAQHGPSEAGWPLLLKEAAAIERESLRRLSGL